MVWICSRDRCTAWLTGADDAEKRTGDGITFIIPSTGRHTGRRYIVKSTGIVRRVDELGRIVLPIEMRRTLDIAERDSLEIYVDGSSVILKKYAPSCIFCNEDTGIHTFHGKNICANCLSELQRLDAPLPAAGMEAAV